MQAGIYLFKVYIENLRIMFENNSKLTKKISERRHRRRSGVFTVNFQHISKIVLVFIVVFEQVNAWWDSPPLSIATLQIT